MGNIKREYSLRGMIGMGVALLRSRIMFPTARIVRMPIHVRGKKYIDFGRGLTTGPGCRIEALRIEGAEKPVLKFGDRVQLNDYVHICALQEIEIGDDVLIASHVYISDNSHGCYSGQGPQSSPQTPPIERDYHTAPVKIGRNVWIGEGVMILPGVTIGEGAVIGAHSVVNRDVEPATIVAGAPAKIIKRYNTQTGRWEKS